MQKKKVRLENGATTRKKPDSGLGIYLAADKVAQHILVDENRRKKEQTKRKQQRIQTPESCVFNKIDLNIFRNSKTPCTAYSRLPPKNQFLSKLLTSGVRLATSQIRGEKQ